MDTKSSKGNVIEIYTGPNCGYCQRAKALLNRKKLPYREFDISVPDHHLELLRRVPRARTIPQIFIGERHLGGCEDLELLESSGGLDAAVREVNR
jgi:glutaredoxin 3